MNNIEYIYPELFLIVSLLILLILGVYKSNSYNFIKKITTICFLLCIPIVYLNNIGDFNIFNNSYSVDSLSNYLKILILLSTLFLLMFTNDYIKIQKLDKFEYPILILSAVIGMFLMVSSNDLIGLYLGIELQSLSLYVLASIDRGSEKSTEAGVKYFVLGALSSGLFLYGCSLLYGFSGSTNYYEISEVFKQDTSIPILFGIIFIIIGLAFKISAVPFHMWSPDVYQGSPTSVTSFFALAPKIAGLGAIIRILYICFGEIYEEWKSIIIFISVASMLLGAFAAIGQSNLKRLMAYSSISHIGYVLAALTVGNRDGVISAISYLNIYIIMMISSFACILFFKRKNVYFENIYDLSGLSKNHPVISFCFATTLFSLAGIPPLAGFFAKFYVFKSVIEANMIYLAIIGLIASVISAFYYLRIVKIMYFDPENEKFDEGSNIGIRFSILFSSIIIIFYFINPSSILYYVEMATKFLN